MSKVLAFFYRSDVAQLAIPLDNSVSIHKLMRTLHRLARRQRMQSFQLMRLNFHKPPTPISHRYIL